MTVFRPKGSVELRLCELMGQNLGGHPWSQAFRDWKRFVVNDAPNVCKKFTRLTATAMYANQVRANRRAKMSDTKFGETDNAHTEQPQLPPGSKPEMSPAHALPRVIQRVKGMHSWIAAHLRENVSLMMHFLSHEPRVLNPGFWSHLPRHRLPTQGTQSGKQTGSPSCRPCRSVRWTHAIRLGCEEEHLPGRHKPKCDAQAIHVLLPPKVRPANVGNFVLKQNRSNIMQLWGQERAKLGADHSHWLLQLTLRYVWNLFSQLLCVSLTRTNQQKHKDTWEKCFEHVFCARAIFRVCPSWNEIPGSTPAQKTSAFCCSVCWVFMTRWDFLTIMTWCFPLRTGGLNAWHQ